MATYTVRSDDTLAGKLGGQQQAAVGVPAPIVPTTGNLAFNRTQYNTDTAAITQPFTSMRVHYAHPDGDVSAVQTVDLNRYLSGIASTATGGVHTIKRYLEYPYLSGTFWQVLWSGASTVSLTAGIRIKSDPVAGLTVAAGAPVGERTVVLTSTNVPVIVMPVGSDILGIDDGNASGDFGNSGTIPPTTGLNTIGCNAMVGTVNATNARSFFCAGDSLLFGSIDATGVGAKGGSGWLSRLLDAHGYPYMKWCIGGQQVADHVTLASTINADAALFGFTDFIEQAGINDLRLGRTETQIKNDIAAMFGQTNITGKRKWPCTLGPRSTSTDAWATTGNQTPQTDGNMAALSSFNDAVRAGLPNAYSFIEAADAFMSSRNSNIHKAPPPGTPDGTHANSVRAALIASLLTI